MVLTKLTPILTIRPEIGFQPFDFVLLNPYFGLIRAADPMIFYPPIRSSPLDLRFFNVFSVSKIFLYINNENYYHKNIFRFEKYNCFRLQLIQTGFVVNLN